MNIKHISLFTISGLVSVAVTGTLLCAVFLSLPKYDITYPNNEPQGIFIYMHGAGGGKEQGRSDMAFKGSFARLKTVLNDEFSLVYVTPETNSFNRLGGRRLARLVDKLRAERPTLPIYLAGASAGGRTTVYAANYTSSLNGLILISPALTNTQIQHPPQTLKRLPLLVEHGTEDTVVDWRGSSEFVLNLENPNAATIFAKGDHNTPLETINWSYAIRRLLPHEPSYTY